MQGGLFGAAQVGMQRYLRRCQSRKDILFMARLPPNCTRVYTNTFGTDSIDRARSSDPINLIVLLGSGLPNKSLWMKYFFAWVALRG